MNRLHGKRKERRDRNVREFAFEHPDQSQEQIAGAFGLTQSAVSKILKKPVVLSALTWDETLTALAESHNISK